MQFLTVLKAFAAVAVLDSSVSASETVEAQATQRYHAETLNWLKTTNPKMTYIGVNATTFAEEPVGILETEVIYCNRVSAGICGGDCTMYRGGSTCLRAPDTQCLRATKDVAFCDRFNCGGSCNRFNSCGTRLNDNFCFAPGTLSILVSF